MNLTFSIAIYGAILSSVTAIIQIFSYRRDRADIKVKIYSEQKCPSVFVTVYNKGRRPVTLDKYIIRTTKLTPSKFLQPIKLLEGEKHDFSIAEYSLIKYNVNDRDVSISVLDGTGRYHWSDNFLMRWIKLRRLRRKIAKVKD